MADTDAKAAFSIDLETDIPEVTDEAAASLEKLRARISGGENAVKGMRSALRQLRGSTDEVKAAKAQLVAKIDAERAVISAGNLALVKQGVTYDQLTAKARKLAIEKEKAVKKKEAQELEKVRARTAALANVEAQELEKIRARTAAMANAVQLAGGPVANLAGRFGALSKVTGGAGLAVGGMTLAVVGAIAVVALLAAGVAAAAVALGRFIVAGANAARTANLFREASTGSAENAHNLGTQVDALAKKVSTGKAALNELATALARNRMSGQATVDTLNAVAQASDAVGSEVGNKIRGFLERGQLSQRFQINPLELMGTGLNYDDIAKPLAAAMKVGIKEARAALFEGRVSLDAGAAAVRAAVEKRFAQVNLRKMLDINVLAQKFEERLDSLTTGVNLDPLLGELDRMSSLFDESTVSGAALKELVTVVGNGLVSGFKLVGPIAAQFFKGLVIAALRLTVGVLKVKRSLVETFRDSKVLGDIDAVSIALSAGKAAVYAIAGAAVVAAVGLALMAAPVLAGVAAFAALVLGAQAAYEWISGHSWGELGTAIVDGLVNGLVAGGEAVEGAVSKLGTLAENAFKRVLGIHSPSRVFATFGAQTAEGFAQGVDGGSSRAQSAVDAMAPTAPPAGRASPWGGAGGGDININVTVIVESGGARGGGNDTAAQLTGPSFRAELIRVFEEAALAAGLLPRGAT